MSTCLHISADRTAHYVIKECPDAFNGVDMLSLGASWLTRSIG